MVVAPEEQDLNMVKEMQDLNLVVLIQATPNVNLEIVVGEKLIKSLVLILVLIYLNLFMMRKQELKGNWQGQEVHQK